MNSNFIVESTVDVAMRKKLLTTCTGSMLDTKSTSLPGDTV